MVRTSLQRMMNTLADLDTREVAMGMTLVLLIFSNALLPFWYIRFPIFTLILLGIAYRPALNSVVYWVGVTAILGGSLVLHTLDKNNHDFLIFYWCLAIVLSYAAKEPLEALRTSSRLLLGLCFALAVFWKAYMPDYVSGDFFHYVLLQDIRLERIAEYFTALSPDLLQESQEMRRGAIMYGPVDAPIPLYGNDIAAPMGRALTWLVLAIEGLVALTFLWPRKDVLSKWRDLAMLAFILCTYTLIPIVHFGWTLCAMGILQSNKAAHRLIPLAYLVLFLALFSLHYLNYPFQLIARLVAF